MDWTGLEKKAMREGAKMFGEYITSIGKQQAFHGITADEYMIAIECLLKEYHKVLSCGKSV